MTAKLWACATACLILQPVWADDSKPEPPAVTWDNVQARGKTAAENAALENSIENLANAIRLLQVGPQRPRDPKQFVADFVAEHPEVGKAIDAFAKTSAQQTGDSKFLPNLTCQVVVSVNTQDIVQLLAAQQQEILNALQNDPQTPPATLTRLRNYNFQLIYHYQATGGKPKLTITAAGIGKPPEQFIRRPTAPPPPPPPPSHLPAWAALTITVKGRAELAGGVPTPEVRAAAERAATFAAQYDAVQKLQEVKLDNKTTIGDFLTAQPKARGALYHCIASAPAQTTPQPDGSIEATLTIPLEKFYTAAKNLLPAAPAPAPAPAPKTR